jgi:hypothetical protein
MEEHIEEGHTIVWRRDWKLILMWIAVSIGAVVLMLLIVEFLANHPLTH